MIDVVVEPDPGRSPDGKCSLVESPCRFLGLGPPEVGGDVC